MNNNVQGAAVLTLLPFVAGFLAYKLIMNFNKKTSRKRKFAAWGAAIGIAWSLSILMKEYIAIWNQLDEIVASTAVGLVFSITLMVLILTVLCGGIGFVIGMVADRFKGPPS